jgi:citrate synthase
MSTLIRSNEASAILGVSKPTLYAYVSRGRLSRTTAADGRSSLFSRDEVTQLAERSRRAPSGPRPTIDVQISSAVTTIDDTSLRYRGHDVTELARRFQFEDVAELLWSSSTELPPGGVIWPGTDKHDRGTLAPIDRLDLSPIGRIAVTAHVLAASHPEDSPSAAARRLLITTPAVLGSSRRTGHFAHRLTAAWRARPAAAVVDAVDAALILLADHELATSTLAVRIAASVRTSPFVAFAAGLAGIEGALHGSASEQVHRFLEACADKGPQATIGRLRAERRPVPGFGHKVYRGVDPRFPPLMEHVRRLDPVRAALVDAVVSEAGRVMAHQPNIDLALGALTWAAGFEPDTPIFAVARIAGWGAHFAEELAERPVRFRGVAGHPVTSGSG